MEGTREWATWSEEVRSVEEVRHLTTLGILPFLLVPKRCCYPFLKVFLYPHTNRRTPCDAPIGFAQKDTWVGGVDFFCPVINHGATDVKPLWG